MLAFNLFWLITYPYNPYHLSLIPYPLITYHLSLVTYHLSLVTYHLSLVTYNLSLSLAARILANRLCEMSPSWWLPVPPE